MCLKQKSTSNDACQKTQTNVQLSELSDSRSGNFNKYPKETKIPRLAHRTIMQDD